MLPTVVVVVRGALAVVSRGWRLKCDGSNAVMSALGPAMDVKGSAERRLVAWCGRKVSRGNLGTQGKESRVAVRSGMGREQVNQG